MLINRVLERAKLLPLRGRLLQRRAHARANKPPVVVVPGMLGTKLVDARGREIWGGVKRLYRPPSMVALHAAKPSGLLGEFGLVPGLFSYDIYGGLVRFLEGAGGYRLGEDLFVLDYNWTRGIADAAADLERLIARVRGISDEKVDLVCHSTGGMIARYYLAYGAQPLADEMIPTGDASVRRAVYVGSPQRGSFDALACLHRGFCFAPGGKHYSGLDAALLRTSWDALPHPDERLFVDERGRRLDLDHCDAATWRGLRLGAADFVELRERLEGVRRLHRAFDRALPHPDVFVIGARHLPTPSRMLVKNGRPIAPPPVPLKNDPHLGFTYQPGDGELPESSLRALPGLDEKRLWLVDTPSAHHRLPSDPSVHRLVLEALLATERNIPLTSLAKSEC